MKHRLQAWQDGIIYSVSGQREGRERQVRWRNGAEWKVGSLSLCSPNGLCAHFIHPQTSWTRETQCDGMQPSAGFVKCKHRVGCRTDTIYDAL
jgi:hypothetical protein